MFTHILSVYATGPQSDFTSAPFDSSGADIGVVTIASWDAYTPGPTISDNKGNTWTALGGPYTVNDPILGEQVQLFLCVQPMHCGPGHTITSTGSNQYGSLTADFFSGANFLTPQQGNTGAATGQGSSQVYPGPVTPVQNDAAIVTGMACTGFPQHIDAGYIGPFTGVPDPYGPSYTVASAYLIQTTAAVSNPLWVSDGSGGASGAIVVLLTEPLVGGNLIGWWYGDGVSPTMLDSSGYGRNAIITSGATLDTAGRESIPQVLSLDGVTGYAATVLQGPALTGFSFTVCCWIKRGSLATGGLICKFSGSTLNYAFAIGYSGTRLGWYCPDMSPQYSSSNNNTQLMETGVWHHVGMVRFGSNIRFFVDGVGAGTDNPFTGLPVDSPNEPTYLGFDGGNYFNGKIYDARVYDRTLDDGEIAAIYNEYPSPVVTSVVLGHGPIAGGQVVVIVGDFFDAVSSITFDGIAATSISAIDDNHVQCTTPAHALGLVDVYVLNGDGQSGTGANVFEYIDGPQVDSVVPNAGDVAGGTAVQIFGRFFTATISDVTFDGLSASNIVRVSSTEITCDTPAHAAGLVDVVVINDDAETGTLVDGYAYAVPPSGPGSSSGHTLGMKMGIGL